MNKMLACSTQFGYFIFNKMFLFWLNPLLTKKFLSFTKSGQFKLNLFELNNKNNNYYYIIRQFVENSFTSFLDY